MKIEPVPLGTEIHMDNGYVQVKTENGWKLKHRLVMEKKLKRPLARNERVYFKNGNKSDYRPSNLEVRVVNLKRTVRAKLLIPKLESLLEEGRELLEELRTESSRASDEEPAS